MLELDNIHKLWQLCQCSNEFYVRGWAQAFEGLLALSENLDKLYDAPFPPVEGDDMSHIQQRSYAVAMVCVRAAGLQLPGFSIQQLYERLYDAERIASMTLDRVRQICDISSDKPPVDKAYITRLSQELCDWAQGEQARFSNVLDHTYQVMQRDEQYVTVAIHKALQKRFGPELARTYAFALKQSLTVPTIPYMSWQRVYADMELGALSLHNYLCHCT